MQFTVGILHSNTYFKEKSLGSEPCLLSFIGENYLVIFNEMLFINIILFHVMVLVIPGTQNTEKNQESGSRCSREEPGM